MINKLTIAFVFFCTSVVSIAQSNDYYDLKDVRKYRFDHLILESDKDVEQFIHNSSEYFFIEALKVNQTDKLNDILSLSGICSYIKELNLKDYSGNYNIIDFDSCQGVEILHLTIEEANLNQLKFLSQLKNLQTLFLYIKGDPENLKGLSLIPQLKELHIIGNFLPNDLVDLCKQIANQTYLQVLSLSVDRITDLPINLAKFKTLSKLNLYDNLSVYTNKGIEDLSEEKLSVIFNIYTDMINAIAISYFSNNGNLADFEINYLQALYKGEILPQQFEEIEADGSKTGNIAFKKEFIPDFAVSPEFNKPYPKITPNSEYFTINPNINSIVYSKSGMKITIPANSFVNELGELISDPIYISLMQIISPTDLLFSGINLKNGDRQFCSQFMFNLNATTEKSSAILKDGYQIKVNMPVSLDSNLTYFFDYESYTLQDLNLYNQVFASALIPIDFYKIETGNQFQSYYQFDSSNFKHRFLSKNHYVLNDYQNTSQLLFKKKHFYADLDRFWTNTYNKSGKLKGLKIKRGKSYVKIQRVIPKDRNKERQYFKILDKTEQGILSELCAFKNINLNVPYDKENKRAFNNEYIKNAKYYDVNIQYTYGKDFCEIILKTNDGFKVLKAFITDSDNKRIIKKELLKFAKVYRKYIKIKTKRELEFNNLNEARFQEYRNYSEAHIMALQKDNKNTEIKIQQLGSFGLMIDVTPIFTTNIIAQYTDLSGIPIDVKDLFMIDTRYNTFFKVDIGNISFDPSNVTCLIATDFSGNLYYANRSDINTSGLSNNSLIYIKLKKVNQGLNSIQKFDLLIRN